MPKCLPVLRTASTFFLRPPGSGARTAGSETFHDYLWHRLATMKIVSWNCPNRFAEKAHLIYEMRPDIAVIQECAKKDLAALEREGYSALWFGSNEKKGLAVFAASPWTIEEIAPPDNWWVVPIQVSGPVNFLLIAIWAWDPSKRGYAGYVEQITEAFRNHFEWFGRGPVIAAGDFNSSSEFDKHITGDNHSSIVSLLEKRGLTSAYHHFYGQQHGDEKTHTYHHTWNRDKPFHLDYIFVPHEWRTRLNSIDVGDVDEWISHSDHCPLVANFTELDSVVPA
jgi:exodeoxyribonuclease-3